ncbi:MAG: ribosomal-processing cysteine protease Prp [Spirochaetaceae bacterium]|jgi:uncharacterized protein YsxB (DUF464 family)|nr:ribosomal-processing cysteine protease Prp [Spirochaetaceae bacterium]
MIKITAEVDNEGILKTCGIAGHAEGGPKGKDPVCGAVSALAGTALRVLAKETGVFLRADVSTRGQLKLETEYAPEGKAFLFAVGAFLLEGLQFVSEEYPNHCTIHIKRRN